MFSPLFTKERLRAATIAYGAVSMAGVLIVIGAGGTLSLDSGLLAGNLLALGVSLCGGFYSAACIPMLTKYSSLRLTSWMFLFGTVFMAPIAIPAAGKTDWTAVVDGTALLALAFNIVVITIICFMLWNSVLPLVGAAKAGFYRYLTPVAAVIAGYLFFNEAVHWLQLVGAVLMIIGLIGVSRPKGGTNE